MASSSDWRRKRPKALGSHDFILGTEPPATAPAPATQLAARRKRPRTRAQRGCAVDLEATIAEGGMFAAVVAMPTAEEEEMWSGPATLCMVTPSAFIAAATVACAQGGTVKLRLRGSETSEAEQQQLCGATDCCADQADPDTCTCRPNYPTTRVPDVPSRPSASRRAPAAALARRRAGRSLWQGRWGWGTTSRLREAHFSARHTEHRAPASR